MCAEVCKGDAFEDRRAQGSPLDAGIGPACAAEFRRRTAGALAAKHGAEPFSNVEPALLGLHEHLEAMYGLQSQSLTTFRERYAGNVQVATSFVREAHFDGYAMRQGDGPCALHYAAGCGCLEVCHCLLERCGRLNFATDSSSRTPLFWAAEAGLCATVQLLLRFGADPAHRDKDSLTALHLAARGGFLRTCSALLENVSVQERCVGLQSSLGFTALHMAAQNGHLEVCRRLVEVDPEQAASRTILQRTPLHLAAMGGYADVASCLLSAKPEVQEARDSSGLTALDHARERENLDVVDVLSAAQRSQDDARQSWRLSFEPPCRALLNVGVRDAFLEIGCSRVLQVEYSFVHVVARIVDAFGAIEAYTVEVRSCDKLAEPTMASMRFGRSEEQLPVDDVEFRVPRRKAALSEFLRPGATCWLRVVGKTTSKAAVRLGLPKTTVCSAWTGPVKMPG